MKTLVCDQCGNHNDPGAGVCALCKDPLDEEREAEQRRSAWTLIGMAAGITLLCVGLPGVLLYVALAFQTGLHGSEPIPVWMFGLGYLILWGVALPLARFYTPKESYDIGDRYGAKSWNPMTAMRQERDENHLLLGCALMPVQMVLTSWEQALAAFERQGRP